MRTNLVLQRLGLITILLLLSTLPTFFLPFTADFFDYNKNTLLFICTIIAGISWAGSMIASRQVKFTLSPLSLPILGVMASWIVSAVLGNANKIESFLTPGQTGTTILLCLLFFFITNLINSKKELSWIMASLFLGFGVMGILNIVWSTIFSSLWNPIGSPITTIFLNFLVMVMAGVFVFRSFKMEASTYLATIVLLISLAAGTLFSYRLYSTSGTNIILMPQSSSWSIALDVLKHSAFFGTGPGSYASAANIYRSAADNMTKNWNIRFGAPSNYYLEIVTTLGILGILGYLIFVYKVSKLALTSVRENISTESTVLSVGLMLLFLVHLFLPATFITISLVFILSALLVVSIKVCNTHAHLVSDTNIDVVTASNSVRTPVLPWIIMTLMLVLAIPSAVMWTRAYIADIYYQQALVAAAANDGKTTYSKLISAVNLNKNKDTYRAAYSQTNFLLATSLSNKEGITEDEKKTVNDLIQEAIKEGKNAVSLAPTKSSHAESLANLYSNLIKIAKDADVWTIAAYRQAISLDPTNPNLLISFGGALYKMENYEEASRMFMGAVNLKPDLPNGYYNLASVYKQLKDYDKAVSAMQEVVKLVDVASDDYTKATKELEELKQLAGDKPKAEVTQNTPSQLTKPDETQAPKVTTPIELDSSLAPQSPATPSGIQ